MYEYRKKIAVFLLALMLMTVVTTQYTKTQVNASVETIVAPFVLDAVVKLLIAVSGAYIVNYINENHNMDLEPDDIPTIMAAIKGLFVIVTTTEGFKLIDNITGEEVNVSVDTSSVAGHLITQTTPTDSHDREFYNWYMSNVSKKLGQYHMRVRQWSDTYSQYIDRYYAEDNPLDLYQYVPTQYQDDYLQLFADMQEMVKSGFETNGADRGFITLPNGAVSANFVNLKTGTPYDMSSHSPELILYVLSFYNYLVGLGYKYVVVSDVPSNGNIHVYCSSNVAILNPTSTTESQTISYVGGYDASTGLYNGVYFLGESSLSCTYSNLTFDKSSGTYTSYHRIAVLSNTALVGDYTGEIVDENSSPFAFPLLPPVLDESGNITLDHGDVQEVPVEEDQDGVPFVPPNWWTDIFDNLFGQVVPGEFDGSLTDMTELELLQEITNNTKKPNYGIVDGTAILELLKDKFGLFYQLYDFFKSILQADYTPEKPEFEVTFNGQLGVHGTYNILNLDWYDNNRSYIMLFITSTTWFFTGLKLFRRLPKAIET